MTKFDDEFWKGRKESWRKVRCKRGHIFDKTNTYIHTKTGAQCCRKCAKLRSLEYRARKKLK
jgi:hypothetical protein